MKKTIAVVLIMLLALTACGGDPAGAFGGSESMDSNRTFSRSKTLACETENTVYAVVRDMDAVDSEGFMFSMLYYFDKETGISGPLCGKPECLHNGPDCNAHLGNSSVYALASYNGRLYWITSAIGPGPANIGRLYSENYDGTDRQLVRDLDDGIFGTPVTAVHFHRGYVYIISEPSEIVNGAQQYRNHIAAYPIDSGEEGFVVLDEETGFSSISAQLYGDSMFILTIDQSENSYPFTFRKWNTETHELETLFDGAPSFSPGNDFWVTDAGIYLEGTVIGSHTVDADGNDAWERNVYFYDFSAGEFETRFPFDTGSGGINCGFTGDLFVVRIRDEKDKKFRFIALDLKGKIVFETSCDTSNWPGGSLVPLSFAGADEENLYFYYSDTFTDPYLAVIPMDGSEPVIVWNGEM